MNWQPELFELAPYETGESPDQRFEAFHRANPHIFRALLSMTIYAIRDGWTHGSMNLFFERLRWLWAVETKGDDYKLNNNFRAYYARLIMAYEPRARGFFRVRTQPNGEWLPNWDRLGIAPPTTGEEDGRGFGEAMG